MNVVVTYSDSVTSIRTLPLGCRVPPWVDNEDTTCFHEVERDTACLERNEKDLDISVVHEVLD